MTNQEYLDEIKRLRSGETIKRSPHMIGCMVREWPCTEAARLKDLCWVMCQNEYVHKNDAIYLLDALETHLISDS